MRKWEINFKKSLIFLFKEFLVFIDLILDLWYLIIG
jgi:hypothetical protein